MSLSPVEVFGVVFSSFVVAVILIALETIAFSRYSRSTTEKPEDIRRRGEIERATTETELQELRLRHERERNQEAEDRMPDSVYYGGTAAH
jgi:hypothetical protein